MCPPPARPGATGGGTPGGAGGGLRGSGGEPGTNPAPAARERCMKVIGREWGNLQVAKRCVLVTNAGQAAASIALQRCCNRYGSFRYTGRRYAAVAQWIEHLSSEQGVGGSNPSSRTNSRSPVAFDPCLWLAGIGIVGTALKGCFERRSNSLVFYARGGAGFGLCFRAFQHEGPRLTSGACSYSADGP